MRARKGNLQNSPSVSFAVLVDYNWRTQVFIQFQTEESAQHTSVYCITVWIKINNIHGNLPGIPCRP